MHLVLQESLEAYEAVDLTESAEKHFQICA